MAMPSSKSSSLGRSNPNSRKSELTDPMRRSFAANPFAKPSLIPAPPSDFPRRNSVGGRESVGGRLYFRDLDDKENSKDSILKQWKGRSPAASSTGTKNFMSPTVSASSKVTVSPRKKVLMERNEPARSSAPSAIAAKSPIRKVTFAEPLHYSCDLNREGEFEASSLNCEEFCAEAVYDDDMNVNFDSKNETESSFETVTDEPDSVILDPSFKLSPTPLPVSSILAPLDADPLMPPPYDPKTNYLSPRPQFLHYRPKQRIGHDDSFVYGSFSDTEVTEDDTQSEGSQKESEDVSSNKRVEEVQSPLMAEEIVEAKEVSKPRLFMRWKAVISLLLLLSAAFISISVTNSPAMGSTVFHDIYGVYESSRFSEFAKAHFDEFSKFAKANFDGLSRNFRTWFTKSLSSISELISNVRGAPSLGGLQYFNLSVLHEYNEVDPGLIFGHGDKDIGEAPEVVYPLVLNVKDIDVASAVAEPEEDDIGDVSAEHCDFEDEEQVQQDVEVSTAVEKASDDALESDEVFEGQPAGVMESDPASQLAEVSEPDHSEVDLNLEVPSSLDSEAAADIHIEMFNAGNSEARQPQEDDIDPNLGLNDQQGLDSEAAEILAEEAYGANVGLMDAATESNELSSETNELQPRMVLYLLLLGGTVLVAGAAFNWSRNRKSRSTRVITSSVEQPLFAKAYKEELSYLNKPSLGNAGATEIEESCPSEMSSIQKSSSSIRQRQSKELNEGHSLEKKAASAKKRRESMATSSDYSMDSPSYGSFTTYEKIQIKNGHGDAEMITPVRRSSRIRSHATSPL